MIRLHLKSKAQKIGTAFVAAALLAFLSQFYHRVTALLSPAPLQRAPVIPSALSGQGLPVAEKPAQTATEAGEKVIKTAFIDCNGIYN